MKPFRVRQLRIWTLPLFWAAALFAAVGCRDTDRPETPDGDSGNHIATSMRDGCDALELAPPKPGEGIQVSIDMRLMPGEERQVCKLVLAGQRVNLNWSEGLYTRGSHHGLTARTTYRDTLPTQNIEELQSALDDPRRPLPDEQREQVRALIDQAHGFVGYYRLRVAPAETELVLDGEPCAETAERLVLSLGEHALIGRARGYNEVRRNLVVEGGEDVALIGAVVGSVLLLAAPDSRPAR